MTQQFGKRLRKLRKERKLTCYRLAKLAGMTEPAIFAIEKGTDPKWSTICKLADALGVEINEFREKTRHDNPPSNPNPKGGEK